MRMSRRRPRSRDGGSGEAGGMTSEELPICNENEPRPAPIQRWQIEGREWWLWGLAVVVTLVLTFGIVSLTYFQLHPQTEGTYWTDFKELVRGLALVVLLFDIYTLYQHLQLPRIRRQLAEGNQLFQLITENA